jgi:hypothetical protein
MILTFGKHKGNTVEEVWDAGDESYLLWLYDQDFVKNDHLDIWSYLDNNIVEIREDYNIGSGYHHLDWHDFF